MGILFLIQNNKELSQLDEHIFSQMRLCSFDLQCGEPYKIDFVPKKNHELYTLAKEKKSVSAYFTLPTSRKNYLKIYITQQQYELKKQHIQNKLLLYFALLEFVIALLSFLFSLYALAPFKNALALTEEFIKDILHDFNTPLATLRLNVSMLQSQYGKDKKIQRIENSVQTILNLQANLRSYLHSHATQKEEIELHTFLQERIDLVQSGYKTITFLLEPTTLKLFANKDALSRIVDNLLSNAAKYNRENGKVFVKTKEDKLIIEDTGKGIKNPKRIFERFYKEQERGIGIGLHIVKKLCDELGVGITVQSKVGEGTTFTLDFSSLTLH